MDHIAIDMLDQYTSSKHARVYSGSNFSQSLSAVRNPRPKLCRLVFAVARNCGSKSIRVRAFDSKTRTVPARSLVREL